MRSDVIWTVTLHAKVVIVAREDRVAVLLQAGPVVAAVAVPYIRVTPPKVGVFMHTVLALLEINHRCVRL